MHFQKRYGHHAHHRAKLNDAISFFSQHGDDWHAPMLRAWRDDVVAVVMLTNRTTVLPRAKLRSSRLPTIATLADDDYDSADPSGWRCAPAALDWAAAIVVHGSSGHAHQYANFVTLAQQCRRLLVVETDSRHAAAWASACDPRKLAALILPVHGPHPAPLDRGAMQ